MKKVLVIIGRVILMIFFAALLGAPIIVTWCSGFVLGRVCNIFMMGFNGKVWYPGR